MSRGRYRERQIKNYILVTRAVGLALSAVFELNLSTLLALPQGHLLIFIGHHATAVERLDCTWIQIELLNYCLNTI